MSPHPEPRSVEGEVGAVRGAQGVTLFNGWLTKIIKSANAQAAIFSGIKISKGKNNMKSDTLELFEQTLDCTLDNESKIILDAKEMKSFKELTNKCEIEMAYATVVTRNFGFIISECRANINNRENEGNTLQKIYGKHESQLKMAYDILWALFKGARIPMEAGHVTVIQALPNWDGDKKPDFVDRDGVQHRVMNLLRLQMSAEWEKILIKNEEWITDDNYEKIVKGFLLMNVTKRIPQGDRLLEMREYGAPKKQIEKIKISMDINSNVCCLSLYI